MELDIKEEMIARRITLSDRRYLIFYEFVSSERATASLESQNEADEPLTEKKEASV